jgi:hypothetical protein
MRKSNDLNVAGACMTAHRGGIRKHSKLDKSAVLAGGEP